MSTESRKESRLYVRSKESVAGTQDATAFDFFESSSCVMTKPPSTMMQETNMGKLGSGEFGTRAELQAVHSAFSVKCSRLSEFLYFMSYFQGKEDVISVIDVPNSIFSHRLTHLPVTSRTMPTFMMLYADGSITHCLTHCLITDFSFTLANGGNGIIDATFNGICNMHYSNAGVLTKQTALVPWVSGAYTTIINAESLINYKGCQFFIGTATEAVPLVQANIAFNATNLANSQSICPFINSVSVTGNNGITAEDAIRACGNGIINNQERKDYAYTLEINTRKDDALPTTSYDALLLADTAQAIEINWSGKRIADALQYGLAMFLPVVQLTNVAEDDESPINQTLSYSVFADSNGTAFEVFGQNKIGLRLNAVHSGGAEASSSQSASLSSSSQGLSSSSST